MLQSASWGVVPGWGVGSATGEGGGEGGCGGVGGVPGPEGVCLPGVVCLVWGDVCSRGGGVPGPAGWVSQHALRQTPLPPCGQTDTCKNITLAQLRCGR